MRKDLNLLAIVLVFASLLMGQSISVVTQSHSHDQEYEHTTIEENHREVDHEVESDKQNLNFTKTSKTKNPVHAHSIVKINSIKLLTGMGQIPAFRVQPVDIFVSFTFHISKFDSVSLSTNLRPPIAA